MRVERHKRYNKAWIKLTKGHRSKALEALRLFMTESSAPQLRLHQLKGEYYPQYSISAGGDLRIHYAKVTDDHIILMAVGTHAQLYE